ncbi:MAG: tetratricopeptide repeat protein, partial [Acidobacteria bacterium]|nr:tetratricopeptide repeat protein [Acidobacteriota bacterium]
MMNSGAFQDLDIVRLRTDLPEHQLSAGTAGTIVQTLHQPELRYRVAIPKEEGTPPVEVEVTAEQMELLRSGTEVAQAQLDLASELNRAGKFEHSLEALDLYLKYRPNDDFGWVNRGINLGALDRFDEGLESFDRALSLNPDRTTAVRCKVQFLMHLGRRAEAGEACDAAWRREYASAESWNELGVALSTLGRLEEAVASFDRAISLDSYIA